MKYDLLPHQFEAIQAMKKCFCKRYIQKSGIISIPTGGGKTYTATYWINDVLKESKVKIIWYAQSFELLNQAYKCMKENLDSKLVIKRISSNKEHYSVKDICVSDDIVLITVQSAIKNFEGDNAYARYLRENMNNIVCILDEAHHAPAYGFRKMILSLKEENTNLWLLGLTATPTYMNDNRRGWLWKIFDQGIIYEVEKSLLQKQGILAKENYIYIKTPNKIILNEEDYTWLAKKHREIPEHIIEEIAENKERNEFIVKEYLKHKALYGKTIIFLDRWYQCEYIKSEFLKYGIKCDVVYSYNNDRKKSNSQVINEFKNDEIAVLLNVKMLTEGTDIPTVKTVFISHETQSYILFNQMIGRCLRGRRAGGNKSEANIVLFGNEWNKSIAWYKPDIEGELSEERINRKSHPLYTFPVIMLYELNKEISESEGYVKEFSEYIPDGWYEVKYIEFNYDENETIHIIEDYVNVLKADKKKYNFLIKYLLKNKEYLSSEWKKENFKEENIKLELDKLFYEFFNHDDIANCYDNVIKIIRHIAQNELPPKYIKSNMNLDKSMDQIVNKIRYELPDEQVSILKREYSKIGKQWVDLYGSFYNFKVAVDLHLTKKILEEKHDNSQSIIDRFEIQNKKYKSVGLKSMISAVKQRDKCCKCCGTNSKKNRLYVELIKPSLGEHSIRNMQTLCSRCRKIAKEIDFTNEVTTLSVIPIFKGIKVCKNDISSIAKIKSILQASINIMYQAGVIFDIKFVTKEEQKICQIIVYSGNPLEWIVKQKENILNYIINDLKQKKVIDIEYKIIN